MKHDEERRLLHEISEWAQKGQLDIYCAFDTTTSEEVDALCTISVTDEEETVISPLAIVRTRDDLAESLGNSTTTWVQVLDAKEFRRQTGMQRTSGEAGRN